MLLLVTLFACCTGILGQTDMGDNTFTFHEQSTVSYVRLIPDSNESLTEATVCMRVNLSIALFKKICLFSFATKNESNDFTLFFNRKIMNFTFSTNTRLKNFELNGTYFQEWTSTCVSWTSSTGKVVVWINEKSFKASKFQKGHVIAGDRYVIIGQDQDTYGGTFSAQQSFVGDIADVNMWDKALTPPNIRDYLNGNDIRGNVINWKALRYEVHGNVTISEAPCIPV